MQKAQQGALLAALVAALAFPELARGQTQLAVSPTSLTLITSSDGISTPQSFTVTSSNGGSIPYTASVGAGQYIGGGAPSTPAPGCLYLSANSTTTVTQTTPSSVVVGFNRTCFIELWAYSGTIVVTSPLAPTVVVPVTVRLPVLPEIASVLNAASFANASAAPGEVVSIFEAGLGPAAPLGAQLDSTGKVSTSLGGVNVYFGLGTQQYEAPLTYVSATQINCVVPYEVAQWMGTELSIEVTYQGPFATQTVQLASASPGIFTATGTGTGQAAALNSDNTPNTASNPAPAGSVVQVYMTGEGQTSPAGVTGSVTCSGGCVTTSQIPEPLSPVRALVGGEPAAVAFYGEAPGLVSGVMQVNVIIPADAPRGAVPLSITVGSSGSQAGVTIAVK